MGRPRGGGAVEIPGGSRGCGRRVGVEDGAAGAVGMEVERCVQLETRWQEEEISA